MDEFRIVFYIIGAVITIFMAKYYNASIARKIDESNRQEPKGRQTSEEGYRHQEKETKKEEQENAEGGASKNWKEKTWGASDQSKAKTESYYRKILELQGVFTIEEVKCNYRRLVLQYHPDKVNHLGQKLKDVAEQEIKILNEAYAYFKKRL